MAEITPEDIAWLRGEALAGQMMAAAAIRLVMSVANDPKQVMAMMTSYIDQTLNGGGSRQPDEKNDAIMRETARVVIDQHLAAVPLRKP